MKESKVVKIYYKPTCPYSIRALKLLESKEGIKLDKININEDDNLREQMIKESGRTTVPQIFIGEEYIGGCDDLIMIESSGKLDRKIYN